MSEQFTEAERAALAPYVTSLDSPVFALRNLPEEVVAVLFAYYSRSRDSLRRNLLKLLREGDLDLAQGGAPQDTADRLASARDKARAFHEKWVVGYGHASVAEHGCVHLALEDISIIASKLIEDARLASYTEKSTRYVAFDPSKVYSPAAVMASPVCAEAYAGTVRALLEAYTGWAEDVVAQIKARVPRTEKQTERGYETACRASAFDILRYLLPAATFTNLGLSLNARSLETLITKLLSQPLPEGRALAERIKSEAQHIVPTLLKYADYSAYRAETDAAMAELAADVAPHPQHSSPHPQPLSQRRERGEENAVTLIATDPAADDRLIAAMLYGYTQTPMTALLAQVARMEPATRERVVDEYLRRRGKHDAPGRALERISCTLEMVMDYGAYRDVQRHRMATQTTQPLTPALGWETPPEIVRFGYGERYGALMARAAETFQLLTDSGCGREAAYVLPLATRVRVLFTWNLREAAHFIELRSARQGHPSYRRIAQQVYRAIAEAHPLVARYLRPNLHEYALTRE